MGIVKYPSYFEFDPTAEYLRSVYRAGERHVHGLVLDRDLLSDIEHYLSFNVSRWSNLLDRRNWRLDRLLQEGAEMRKPRLFTRISITEQDNLTFRWYPVRSCFSGGSCLVGEQDRIDLGPALCSALDELHGGRPHNELLFLHDFGAKRTREDKPFNLVDHCLILAVISLIHLYARNLSFFFDVEPIDGIEPIFAEERLFGWRIFNVGDRQSENDVKFTAEASAQLGIGLEDLGILLKSTNDSDQIGSVHDQLKNRGLAMGLRDFRPIVERLVRLKALDMQSEKITPI